MLALRAAAAGVPAAAIVAYEPPFVIPGSREVADNPGPRIREMVEAGAPPEVLAPVLNEFFLR